MSHSTSAGTRRILHIHPKVSILIPAFNAELWVSEAINSALAQTWENKEIIVIDDGSRDATLEVARSFAATGIQIHTHSNRGASATRNRALALASGDFIQWLDADDILASDKVERQFPSIENRSFLLSSAWTSFYYRPGKSRFTPNLLWQDLDPASWLCTKMETNAWMAIQSWLVPRGLAEAAGPWDETLTADDDGEYFARLVSSSSGIRFFPCARSFCRAANPRSLSKGFTSEKWLRSQYRALILQISSLRKLGDTPRIKGACVSLLQRWFVYFHPEFPEITREMQELAHELGGQISAPKVRWKYRPIQFLLGWKAAKRAQFALPTYKAWLQSNLDRLAAKLRT